jgi:hypothetical protein
MSTVPSNGGTHGGSLRLFAQSKSLRAAIHCLAADARRVLASSELLLLGLLLIGVGVLVRRVRRGLLEACEVERLEVLGRLDDTLLQLDLRLPSKHCAGRRARSEST